MPLLSQDRLVRKEVALGLIREFEPPQEHIGLSIAPFLDVQSDDVIFDYVPGLTAGMAPARAEDAEAEIAGKDDYVGTGRASLIDWAHKDHYRTSDITRYRESLIIRDIAGATNLPLTVDSMLDGFQNKVARQTARRRRMLDNRMEWLIMTALDTGAIAYNDGRIMFNVDFGRPSNQNDVTPVAVWSDTANADPIKDIEDLQYDALYNKGVHLNRIIMSRLAFKGLKYNTKFQTLSTGAHPTYTVRGWSDAEALAFITDQLNLTDIIVYDSVYRTRPLGSHTITNNRFTRSDRVILLPSQADLDQLDDTEIGFAKTLTAPHAEGNWTSGFYEWERETVDPWSYDIGTGIKAFPVFPHMDLTYTIKIA